LAGKIVIISCFIKRGVKLTKAFFPPAKSSTILRKKLLLITSAVA